MTQRIQTQTRSNGRESSVQSPFDDSPGSWYACLQVYLEFVLDALRVGVTLGVSIVIGLLILLFISPLLAIPGLISLFLAMLIDFTMNREQQGLMATSVEASQRRQAFIFGTLSQIPLIRRHGSLRRCRMEFAKLSMRTAAAASAIQILQGWRTTILALLRSGETLMFAALSAWFMAKGNYTIGGLVALGVYKDVLAGALAGTFQLCLRHQTLAVHRIQAGKLLGGHCMPSDEASGPCVENGRLSARNVSYRYGSLDELVIDDLNFELDAGQCLVMKGRSGTGKSTIAKMLTGILVPYDGVILVDDVPLRYPVTNLGSVLQSDTLISGSIRENISLYRSDVTDQAIWESLDICLATDFVRDMPMRLNSFIAENVSGISGGQRQRLLIARAIVGKPKILILDEATASLDVEAEATIMSNLRAMGITIVVISHRPEVWKIGDHIMDLDEKRLVREENTSPDRMSLAS